ncbi:MAG: hypothetical protein ACK528_05680, partial [Alphaproteobacteria bacterium]
GRVLCETVSGQTTLTATGAPTGGTFAWSGPGITAGGVYTIPQPAVAGDYIMTVTYTAPVTGCQQTDTALVRVIFNEPANAGNGLSVCANAGATVLTSGTPAGGTWSGTGVTGGNTFTPTAAMVAQSPIVLTYTVGTGNCQTTDTLRVTVRPLPTPTATSNTPRCVNQTLTLTGGGGVSYAWSGPNAFTSTDQAPNITPVTLAAAGTYTVTVTGANGCSNTATTSVVINPLPTVTGTGRVICETFTGQTTLTATGAPTGGTFAWSGTGVTAGGVFTVPVVQVADYILTVTYTAPVTGCQQTDTALVRVIANTPANAGNGLSVCSNAGATVLTSGTPAGGTWSGTGVTGGNTFTPTAAMVAQSPIVLTYTVGTGNCQTTDT